jgi:hypothetical protein
MNKHYLEIRTNRILDKAINEQVRLLQSRLEHDPSYDSTNLCYEIGLLTALKNQAKDIIEKL